MASLLESAQSGAALVLVTLTSGTERSRARGMKVLKGSDGESRFQYLLRELWQRALSIRHRPGSGNGPRLGAKRSNGLE